MTIRSAVLAGVGVLVMAITVSAQTGVPVPSEAHPSQYVDAVAGLTLQDAIGRALEQEPTLRAARTEVEMARGMRLQAGLRPNPTVSFMQQEEPAGTDNQSRFEIEWPLDLFRKAGRVAVADREIEAIERAVADRERVLSADVRMKYGDVLAAIRELEVSDDLVATTARRHALVRARAEQGSSPPLERNLLEVELRRLEAERLLQAGKVERALTELKRLLGLSPDARLQVRDTLDQLVQQELMVTLPTDTAAAVAKRADIQEAEARIAVADARLDRARREGRFDVSVFGMYMRMDAGFPQRGLNGAGDLERVRGLFHYLSGGAMVTVPVRNRNQGEIASAQAARSGAATRLVAAQLTAEAEIAAARARDEHAGRAVSVYRDGAQRLSRQNLEVVTQTYELGRGTIFDVLAEQRRYLDVERAYSTTLREAYEARTALRRALGEVR